MAESDLYKLFSSFDSEADLSDLSPSELEELLARDKKKDYKQSYFEYYDDVKVDGGGIRKKDW